MIYFGQESFQYLSVESANQDPGESSHWKKYNENLKFSEDGFQGVWGFGSDEKPYKGLKKILHTQMQRKYRKIGGQFPEFSKIDQTSKEIANKQNRAYGLDMLRQVLTISFLKQYIDFESQSKQLNTCVIGDGFATMTCLLQSYNNSGLTIMVNLTKTLMVDLWYLRKYLGQQEFDSSVRLVTNKSSLEKVIASKKANQRLVVAIQAKHSELLQFCLLDLVINIASMQEMHPGVVADYFKYFRVASKKKALFFYCCNREEKVLPAGEVVRFLEYPWSKQDEIKVDGFCPWHQQYYILKPPMYKNYDGPVRHRLAVLN